MANTFAPFGFRQFRRFDGGAPTAGFDTLNITSSDTSVIGTGDCVITIQSTLVGANGPYVSGVLASSGIAQIRGVFFGCEFFSPTIGRKVWSPFWPGSVQTSCGSADAQAWVCTDPDMLYIAQCSTTNTVTSSMVNHNFGISSGAVNTTTGLSASALGSSTGVVTATLPWRLIDFYSNWAPPGTNGTDNASAGNIVVVAPNNFDRNNTTGL